MADDQEHQAPEDAHPKGTGTGPTIKTPLGPMNKDMMLVVGALAAGIVGFAWWRNRSASAATDAATAATDAALTPATDFDPSPSEDSTVSSDTSTTPSTNAEWTQQAISYLSSIGFDPGAVATALGLYLARQPLTADQQAIVNDARAAIGDPPVGGPYPIVTGLPTTTGTPIISKPPVTTPPPAGTTKAPPKKTAHNYTVVKGDTLTGISQKVFHTTRWSQDIYNSNRAVIEAAAKAHGKANSANGHWIYPGTVLVLTY